jgi:hypothetical protein
LLTILSGSIFQVGCWKQSIFAGVNAEKDETSMIPEGFPIIIDVCEPLGIPGVVLNVKNL